MSLPGWVARISMEICRSAEQQFRGLDPPELVLSNLGALISETKITQGHGLVVGDICQIEWAWRCRREMPVFWSVTLAALNRGGQRLKPRTTELLEEEGDRNSRIWGVEVVVERVLVVLV